MMDYRHCICFSPVLWCPECHGYNSSVYLFYYPERLLMEITLKTPPLPTACSPGEAGGDIPHQVRHRSTAQSTHGVLVSGLCGLGGLVARQKGAWGGSEGVQEARAALIHCLSQCIPPVVCRAWYGLHPGAKSHGLKRGGAELSPLQEVTSTSPSSSVLGPFFILTWVHTCCSQGKLCMWVRFAWETNTGSGLSPSLWMTLGEAPVPNPLTTLAPLPPPLPGQFHHCLPSPLLARGCYICGEVPKC